MMVIGCGCLVGQQADLFQQAKKGQIYTRQILSYKSDIEIAGILSKYKSDIENIGCKYAREAFILLDGWPVNLDYQTILQFVSIPQISTQLSLYYDYIESIIQIIPTFETLPNGTRVRKFNSNVQKPLENFRELTNKCTLYFPFAKLKSIFPNKIAFTYDLKSGDNNFQPSAFNEHFGMFVSSKEYHLFEPEKGTPQDYNNMIGTPINEIVNPETKKDYSIWNEGSRVVPNMELRPIPSKS
jgi:hypothetical protein